MSLRDKIDNLLQAELSETEIVHHLGITHLAYRRHAAAPAPVLPDSARRELYYSDLREDQTLQELAHLYRVAYSQIHQALYNKPSINVRVFSKNAVLAHLQLHDNIESMAKAFAISKRALPGLLDSIGWHYNKMDFAPPYNSSLAKEILRALKEAPKLTYQALANQVGCHRSYITQVAKANGINKQEQNKQHWPTVLAYAQEHGITTAANKFGISRASIYYHKRKGNE